MKEDDLDRIASKDDAPNKRIWNYMFTIDRSLLIYKIFYMTFTGAVSSIISFLPLQMKQLGLSPSRIGIASATRPVIASMSTALICLISDRIGYRRTFMCGLTVLMMASGVTLAMINNPDEAPCKDQPDIVNMTGGTLAKRDLEKSACCDIDDLSLIKRALDSEITNETAGMSFDHRLVINRSWQYNDIDLFRTFIIVLIVGSFFEAFFRPSESFADAATLGALTECNKGLNEYGNQRCWGNLFWDFGAFASGLLLTFTREEILKCGVTLVNADYRIVLVPFCVFLIGALICIRWFQFSSHENEPNWKELKILVTPHHIIILSAFLFFGIFNGVVWGFLFWHLENLGASHGLLSTVILFQAASEVPAGYLCSISIEYLGYWNSLHLGFLVYTVRFVVLYLIQNPWWSIIIEILQGFAFCQTWSVLLAYVNTFVPANLSATLCGICSTLYFSLGVSVGYLITGFMVETIGGSATFGYYALVSLVFSVIFAVSIRMVRTPIPNIDPSNTKLNPRSDSPSAPGNMDPEELVLLPQCPVEVTKAKQQMPSFEDKREAYIP